MVSIFAFHTTGSEFEPLSRWHQEEPRQCGIKRNPGQGGIKKNPGQGGAKKLIVAGVLNGHVGEEREVFQRQHGGKAVERINKEGDSVLEFARRKDMAVTNTFFVKSAAQMYTYWSGLHQTQIDYIMI